MEFTTEFFAKCALKKSYVPFAPHFVTFLKVWFTKVPSMSESWNFVKITRPLFPIFDYFLIEFFFRIIKWREKITLVFLIFLEKII